MAKSVKVVAVNRIVVDKPETFANTIRSKFAARLNIQSVSLKEKKLTHNEVAYVLRGPGEVAITDTQLAVPINTNAARPYWLGANITFEPYLGRYALKSVSLKIYQGLASDRKSPILRAEWDIPNTNTTFVHAQPHWHAYPAISRLAHIDCAFLVEGSETLAEIPAEIIEQEFSDGDEGISDFHLAMASSWHVPGNGTHQLPLSDKDGIVSWVDGCILYMIQQLTYLSQ